MSHVDDAIGYSPNADYWVHIMRERLDRYRTELTDPAVLGAVGDVDGLDVLDAGCGEGYLSRMLAERGARVTGVDLDPALIRAAQDLEAAEGRGIAFHHGDAAAIPAEAGSFDRIVANHLLNDIEDIGPVVADLARVLRPGGTLVALVLHPCHYWARRGLDETDPAWPDRYFATLPREQGFNVAGLESPTAVRAWYRPLEDYSTALAASGLVITGLQEPHPTSEQQRDPWWQAGWSKPMFLLITAQSF